MFCSVNGRVTILRESIVMKSIINLNQFAANDMPSVPCVLVVLPYHNYLCVISIINLLFSKKSALLYKLKLLREAAHTCRCCFSGFFLEPDYNSWTTDNKTVKAEMARFERYLTSV